MAIEDFAIRPSSEHYDGARTTMFGTGTPAVVLRPSSTVEVADALRYASAERLPLAVRGGGHSMLNHSNVDDGAVLDLSRLDSVEVLGEGRVRIGGGASWGPVAQALAEHGLAVTSGDTRSVGVGGLIQAGGMGWMVRQHGLTIDSLLAAEVVTATGEVVRAKAEEHPDLFWAIRGGAGNVGVVTAFELQAQPVSTIHFGTIGFALDDVPQLLEGWAAAMAVAPDEVTTALALMPARRDVPAGAMMWVALCGDDLAALEPLRAIGTVLHDDVAERAYADVLEEAHPPAGVVPVVDNTLVEAIDDDLVAAVAAAYAGGGRVVFLRSLGGAFSRVDPEATAFAHRSAQAMIVSAAFLPPGSSTADVEAAREVWRPVGARGIGAYAGFLGSETPVDLASLWPPATLARLREVKRAWDPGNTFRRNFNIAP